METRMERSKTKIFIFGWPSFLGGADTKLHHLLLLLHNHCNFTIIPNLSYQLHQRTWTDLMDRLGIRYCLLEELPSRLEGIALAFSNQQFFRQGIARRVKEKGLKVFWSPEMMWHFEDENNAIRDGIIDCILYASEFQRDALSLGFDGIPGTITGNYIDPEHFPFVQRDPRRMAIGRLSRPDPDKFPEDFPVFYECLDLPNVRFRVMAWSRELRVKYCWHRFDNRWDLLREHQEPQAQFLQSLDLFVYPLGHKFQESWGRSTVEAMLTGCIPLVPQGHFFENLIVHGRSGFICSDFLEYQEHARTLADNAVLRHAMSLECRRHAERNLCDRDKHLDLWLKVFYPREN
jgi:hypothetical protein